MDKAAVGRRRRVHGADFKAQAVQAQQQPSFSLAVVAKAHGINANLLRRWIHQGAQSPADAAAVRGLAHLALLRRHCRCTRLGQLASLNAPSVRRFHDREQQHVGRFHALAVLT
ncbi:hypothetical protein CDN99_23895 [Roseateles aquatilis]|uniref:Transposase n=1 Tax=Roseateles aquatilis TaxID=431061 RepID=A0A246IX43_9BURK|nr:hypothetical protein CDN99_23895 [Roseateles aquatilis]